MVLFLLQYGAETLFGYFFARKLSRPGTNPLIIGAWGLPIGISFSVITYQLSAILLGTGFLHAIIHVALISALCVILLPRHKRTKLKFLVSYYHIGVFAAYFLATFVLGFMVYFKSNETLPSTMLPFIHEEMIFTASFKVGVNSGHLTFLQIHHPDCPGFDTPTRWMTAQHSAISQHLYGSLRLTFSIPTALLVGAFAVLEFELATAIGIHPYFSTIVPLLTLLTAGYGALDFADHNGRHKSINPDFVYETRERRTQLMHPVLHILLGIRSSALALAASAGAFLALYQGLTKDGGYLTRMAGLLAGLVLPGSLHQAFFGFLVFLIVLTLKTRNHKLLDTWIALGLGLIPHIPHYLQGQFWKGIRFSSPWDNLVLQGTSFAPIRFEYAHTGYLLLTFVLGYFYLKGIDFDFYLASGGILLLYAELVLQHSPELNTLVFYASFLPIASVLITKAFIELTQSVPSEELSGFILGVGVLLLFGGFSSSIWGTRNHARQRTKVWENSATRLVDWITKSTSVSDVFLSSRYPLDPVSALAGRMVFVPPHESALFEGLDIVKREDDAQLFWTDTSNISLIPGVKYLVVPAEGGEPNASHWKSVFSTRDVQIFEIHSG